MSDAPNNFRREVALALNGATYQCRPTLDKMARIEGRLGAAMPLMQRIAQGNVTQAELSLIVGVMLRDVRGAPKADRIADLVYAAGVVALVNATVAFLDAGLAPMDLALPAPDDEADPHPGN